MAEFEPEEIPGTPADDRSDFLRWAAQFEKNPLTPEDADKATTDSMEAHQLNQSAEAAAAQRRSEALAKIKLATTQPQMPAQVAALDQEAAFSRENRDQEQTGFAIARLHANIHEQPPGQLAFLDPVLESQRQPVIEQVYSQMDLTSPINELQADNRTLLGKLFRRPNRTSQVSRRFDAGDTPSIITATRFYSKPDKAYKIALYGGKVQDAASSLSHR